MNKQVNAITKANGSKDTNEVTKYSTEDESTILTLERAKGLAEYISKIMLLPLNLEKKMKMVTLL